MQYISEAVLRFKINIKHKYKSQSRAAETEKQYNVYAMIQIVALQSRQAESAHHES